LDNIYSISEDLAESDEIMTNIIKNVDSNNKFATSNDLQVYFDVFVEKYNSINTQWSVIFSLLNEFFPKAEYINEVDIIFRYKNRNLDNPLAHELLMSRIKFKFRLNKMKQKSFNDLVKCMEESREFPIHSCLQESHL